MALMALFWVVRVQSFDKGIYVRELLLNPSHLKMAGDRLDSLDLRVESIDYSYFAAGKWEMVSFDLEPYKKLWDALEGDRGAAKVDPAIIKLFEESKISTLAIYVRKQVPYQKEGLNMLYQQIQLPSVGDYYRVQIPGEDNKGHWVYFYHPTIQKIILEAKHG